MDFTAAEDLEEKDKQKCVELIEKGMNDCNKCDTTSTDNLQQMCRKHLKMYSTLYP